MMRRRGRRNRTGKRGERGRNETEKKEGEGRNGTEMRGERGIGVGQGTENELRDFGVHSTVEFVMQNKLGFAELNSLLDLFL